MHTILEQHNVSSSSFINAQTRARAFTLSFPHEVIRVKELIGYQSNSIPKMRMREDDDDEENEEEKND